MAVEGAAGRGVDEDDEGDVLGVEVVDGITVTTTVDVATHPTSKQAYPGTQQPPPGFCGQLI